MFQKKKKKEFVSKGAPLLSQSEIENIFGNIMIIYNFHFILYEELEKEWELKGLFIDIPSVFLNKIHFLKM